MDTHWIDVSDASRSRASVSIATLTIVVSRIDMIVPSTTTDARRSRSRSSPISGHAIRPG